MLLLVFLFFLCYENNDIDINFVLVPLNSYNVTYFIFTNLTKIDSFNLQED